MIKFTKMHGCGNDYLYINCLDGNIPENIGDLAVKMSDRHKGAGSDGIILICPSDKADGFMRMFNADGSEGKMCGNAIRCVGKYLYDNGYAKKDRIYVDTLSGIKILDMVVKDGKAVGARVNMGAAIFDGRKIPADYDGECIGEEIFVGGGIHKAALVSMGNPHCVVFCDDPDKLDLEKIGPAFEHDKLFPKGVNTEFICKTGENRIRMRVWERGSGETLACGTGACASVSACVKLGMFEKNAPVTVSLIGGELTIEYTDEAVFMTGEAVKVYDGVFDDEG